MIDLVLHAIAEPRRREILGLIRDTERSSGGIAAHFEVTRPAISQHLQVLSSAGLVTMRRQGTQCLYRARPEGLTELRTLLDQFWQDHLQLLKQEAETEERRSQDEVRAQEGNMLEWEVRIEFTEYTIIAST